MIQVTSNPRFTWLSTWQYCHHSLQILCNYLTAPVCWLTSQVLESLLQFVLRKDHRRQRDQFSGRYLLIVILNCRIDFLKWPRLWWNEVLLLAKNSRIVVKFWSLNLLRAKRKLKHSIGTLLPVGINWLPFQCICTWTRANALARLSILV